MIESFFNAITSQYSFYLQYIAALVVVCYARQRRSKFVLRLIPCLIVLLLWEILEHASFIPFDMILVPTFFAVFYILTIPCLMLCFKEDIFGCILLSTFAYMMQHISYNVYEALRRILSNAVDTNIYIRFVMMYGITALIYVAVWFIYIRTNFSEDKKIVVEKRYSFLVFILAIIFAAYLSSWGRIYAGGADDVRMNYIINGFSVICSVFCIMLLVSLFLSKEQENELEMVKHMIHEQRKQFKENKESIDIINMKCHDLKHQVTALKGKLDTDEIDSISHALDIYDSMIKTGSDALDVVLREKMLLCKSKDIRLTCMIDGSKLCGLKDSDIYTLFGNAIDNAIEGVEDLPEDMRIISISNLPRGEMVDVHIENYFKDDIVFVNGRPQTKKDKNYHGFGMKSMDYIVRKYGGNMRTSIVNDLFVLDFCFPESIAG